MRTSSHGRIHPLLAAALSALVVGIPAGYILAGVSSGRPPVYQDQSRTSPTSMDHATMPGMKHDQTASPATRAFQDAAAKMHADMEAEYTGDVDLDFARGMVPHHRGAVDMARIELEHGTDPQMRRLAETVIRTQNQEISMMQQWMVRRGASR